MWKCKSMVRAMKFKSQCCLPLLYNSFGSRIVKVLIYQPVLPHGLIIFILKINYTTNNYNYLFHALPSIGYSNTYYKIYISHNIVAIDFILHHISMCVWYIYLIKLFIYELVFLFFLSYINTQWHLSWVVFLHT